MHRTTILAGLALATFAAGLTAPAVASADDPMWTVQVHVVTPSGGPAPGVFVAGNNYGFGTTDHHGRVTLEMPGPPQEVCATLGDSSQHLAGPTGWAPACASIPDPVGLNSRVTLRFTVGAALTGRLVDARTGQPIPHLRVAAYGLSRDPFNADDGEVTAADGTWLIRNLATGNGVLYANASSSFPGAPYGYTHFANGGPDHEVQADVVGGSTTDLGDLPVSPTVRYQGTVTDASGTAAAGASVQVGDIDGDPTTPFLGPDGYVHPADASGHYAIDVAWTSTAHRQVCAYSGVATTAHPTGLALRCAVVDSTALTVPRNLALAAGGAVHGTVAGASGSYSSFVRMRVNGEDVMVTGVAEAQSTYRILGVTPGRRVATVSPSPTSSSTASSGPITVVANSTTEVPTITLP